MGIPTVEMKWDALLVSKHLDIEIIVKFSSVPILFFLCVDEILGFTGIINVFILFDSGELSKLCSYIGKFVNVIFCKTYNFHEKSYI